MVQMVQSAAKRTIAPCYYTNTVTVVFIIYIINYFTNYFGHSLLLSAIIRVPIKNISAALYTHDISIITRNRSADRSTHFIYDVSFKYL